MAELIAVATLHLVHVARLSALVSTMALTIAVAADDLLLLSALLGRMAFFAAVEASAVAAATLRAIAREMAG